MIFQEDKINKLEQELRDLVKEFHTADPMRACVIEPVISKKAQEYQKLSGKTYFYSLARSEAIYA